MTSAQRPKLGKKPARHDPRTLRLRQFLHENKLPPIPPAHDQAQRVRRWPVLGNRDFYNCTCASAAHLIHAWTARVDSAVILSKQAVMEGYAKIIGHDEPVKSPGEEVDALKALGFWRKSGFSGHRIKMFAKLDLRHPFQVRLAVFLFGGAYVGLNLPDSAHRQKKIWRVPKSGTSGKGAPGTWGGHMVPVISYDKNGLTCITWGRRQQMTWEFWETYCDEAYAVLSRDLFDGLAIAPAGVDFDKLETALKAFA